MAVSPVPRADRATRALIINQFALPRDTPGFTRHVDLLDALPEWDARIIAGARHYYSDSLYTTQDPRFVLVPGPPHQGGLSKRLPAWANFCLRAAWTGMRYARQADLVWASSPQLFVLPVGVFVARVTRRPLILEVRDIWPESAIAAGALRRGSLVARSLEYLEVWCYRRADAIVVVSDRWSEHFRRCGVPSEKVHHVPNGADVEMFDVAASREELRRDLGLTRLTAVFAGAHGRKDGIEYILAAAQQCPFMDFVLIGDGDQKVPAMQWAADRQLTNVRFLDMVPKADLPAVLKACDIGIHCVAPLSIFKQGMSPNKLFDYWAAGLPVVSNAGEGVLSIAPPGGRPFIGGPDGLAQNLTRLAALSEVERRHLGRVNYEHVRANFSRRRFAQRLLVIEEGLRAHGSGGRNASFDTIDQ